MKNELLVLNSILLAAITVWLSHIFVVNVIASGRLWSRISRKGQVLRSRLINRSKRVPVGDTDTGLTLADRIQLKFIERSGIRTYIPFFSTGTLSAACLLVFAALFRPVFRTVNFIPSAVIVTALFSMLPVFILDVMARYNSARIRRSLAEFISVLNRWCAVREDIFYAFEKSLDSGIREPLATFIRDMIIQVRSGIAPGDALDMLRMKVGNPQFEDFIVNIRQSVKHRGDIRRLLSNMEDQFYRMEEEYNRRRISTFRDRVLVYALMFAVFFICYGFIRINPDVEAFYTETVKGRMLITLFCVLYGLGFYVSLGISKYEH